jgi:hypothetical protein
MSALQLDVYLRPGFLDAVAPPDQAVESKAAETEQGDKNYGNNKQTWHCTNTTLGRHVRVACATGVRSNA